MDKRAKHRSPRTWVQVLWAALTNGYAAGFLQGRVYTGRLKLACVPGLNCYSCPGALGSCPIGAVQAVLASREYGLAFYAFGFMMAFGALCGRFVCGWLCPFGLVQDLLYKIPFVKKIKKLPGERALRMLRYAVLAGLVVVLPLTLLDIVGQGRPWFCKLVCPSGTLLGGLPLLLANAPLREAAGGLFAWKLGLLIALLLACIPLYRPFCRYLCPLGAVYGLFNPIALYRYRVDADTCVRCGACERACPMGIAAVHNPNSMDCIRCGRCVRACPTGSLVSTAARLRAGKSREEGV